MLFGVPKLAPTSHPVLRQIDDLNLLVTTRLTVSDIVESGIAGNAGSVMAAVLCRGEGLWAVDLSAGHFSDLNSTERTAVLTFPPPTLLSARLDLRHSRLWDVRQQGLWMLVPGNDARVAAINRAYRDAQTAVERASSSPQIRARAMAQARQSIGAFYASVGWRVTVAFDPPTPTP